MNHKYRQTTNMAVFVQFWAVFVWSLDKYINFVLSKCGDKNKKIMKKIMWDDGKGFLTVSLCLIPIEESIDKSQSEPDIQTLPISSNDEIQLQKTRRSQRFIYRIRYFSRTLMKHILIIQ